MTNPDELNALALRCEREEASRMLDRAIAAALGYEVKVIEIPEGHPMADVFKAGSGLEFMYRPGCDREGIPPWTSSLDAAVSLVPEGMVAAAIHYVPQLDPKMPASGVARVYSDDLESGRCTGRTAALALCAAALRARAALAGDGAPADPPKVRE